MARPFIGVFLAILMFSIQLGKLESINLSVSSLSAARLSLANSVSASTIVSHRPVTEKLYPQKIHGQKIAAMSGAATGLGILASQWRSIIQLLRSIHEQQQEEQEYQLQLQQKRREMTEMRKLYKNSTMSATGLQQTNVHVDHHNHTAGAMTYLQTLTAGAVSRSMAQTLLHPAYTYKTLLQLRNVGQHIPKPTLASVQFSRLLKGIDAQFLLSLPHGAFHFFVIDQVSHNHL